MRQIYFILLLMFFANHLSSQDNCRYGDYFDLISLAQEDLGLKKNHQANEKYRLAFSKVEVPFSKDLKKALELAINIKDTARVRELCIILAEGGIPLSFFKDFKHYKWYPNFELQFENYVAYYKSCYDLALRSKLLELRTLDSLYNEQFHAWRRGEIESTFDELVYGATVRLEGFKTLVNTHGYPSEKRMGYYYANGEIVDFPIYVIIRHIYQSGELLYKESLPDLFCQGDIPFEVQNSLEVTRGYGNGTGIVQDMTKTFEFLGRKK